MPFYHFFVSEEEKNKGKILFFIYKKAAITYWSISCRLIS